LSAAHARGVVHGALKPEGCALFAGPGGSYLLKVGDFGIARLIAPAAASPAVYQAPEQRAGGEPDPSVDCYALGAILYEMIVSSPPPLTAIPLLRMVRPDAPADLEALVARCLASTPSDRFSRMSELAEALDALVAAMGSVCRSLLLTKRQSSSDLLPPMMRRLRRICLLLPPKMRRSSHRWRRKQVRARR
jgi:serine/threonine protein kinase